MAELLEESSQFCRFSLMDVNPAKCVTVSSVWFPEGGGCRGSTPAAFEYRGVELPKLGIQQSSKYLGIPIGGHKHYRSLPSREALTVMREQLERISKSPLLLPQKIDALHTFVLCKIDYLLQSGDISKSQLDEFDAHVRGQVQSWIGGKGIPRPIFHMSWKDGGLSLPTAEGRLNTMVVRTVVQLLKTQDRQLRKIFRAFLDEERDNRHFADLSEGTTATGFLNWHQTATSGLNPEMETTTIFWKAFEAARRLKLEIKPVERNCEQITIAHALAAPRDDVSSKDVSQYITQQICRRKWREELYCKNQNEEPQFRAGQYFYSLQENPISNRKLKCSRVRTDDGNMKFLLRARCNTLPTPENR